MSLFDHRMSWPDEKRFAFTIFDDPDAQTTATGREAYACLRDLGFRTTKGVWPLRAVGEPSCNGECCEDAAYLEWCLQLQQEGFEIGFHNASQNTSDRAMTIRGFDAFKSQFGADPTTMANHYNANEGIYWGDERLSGVRRAIYNVATRFGNRNRFFGHVEGHRLFWGDICRSRVHYVRNFVFPEINTLRACPWMPYFDPDRPLVARWYASSEGSDRNRFVSTISERNQDQLVEEGGACIMYTHFGHGYVDSGRLDRRWIKLMERLSALGGWFVPVGELLRFLEQQRGVHTLTPAERQQIEWRWLRQKLVNGTS
jgi:hypothetical protein